MLFKLQLHYNYNDVGKRFTDILICHKCIASTPLSSAPFCRVLGKCQSRLQKNLLWAAVRKHDLPSPEKGGLSGMESDQPKCVRACVLHVCMRVWWGEGTEGVGSLWLLSYDAECIVHFNGEGNFSFPSKIRISLSGMANDGVSLPWVFPR